MRFNWDWTPSSRQDPIEQIQARRNYGEDFLQVAPLAAHTLPDLDRAIERILDAVKRKQPLVIHGDDDPDGICSAYILFDYLQRIGSHGHYFYIRNRLTEPHGLHPGFVEHVRAHGYGLVVTVDGGSSSFEGIRALSDMGVHTIVTDHHLLPEGPPPAYAVVNPKCAGADPDLVGLCGAGVVWLLVRRMAEYVRVEPDPAYLVWAAVGPLADKVPLLGFNRTLCRQAVDGLFEHADETLKQLMQALYISCESSARIAFLHQVGRLFSGGHAADGDNLSLRLMLAPQVEKGAFLRALLAEKARYDEQAGMVVNFLMENPPAPDDACFLLHDENDDIPYNLCSLAAAFITGNYKIPALVLKRRQGDLVCEARSTDGFNLVEAFFACRETMADYGGHARAAGCTLLPGQLPRFRELLNQRVEEHREQIFAHRRIRIDAEVQPRDLNADLLRGLSRLMPFGSRNPEPVFLMRNVRGGFLSELFQTDMQLEQTTSYDLVFHLKSEDYLQILDYAELQ